MNFRPHLFLRRRRALRRLALALVPLVVCGVTAHAGTNLTRGSGPTSRGSSSASATSQTATAATTATSQASQSATLAQLAQASLQRSVTSLQALQAQQNAQSAARNLAAGQSGPRNLGTASQSLLNVGEGLYSVNGLVPGVVGVDPTPANAAAITTTVPVTVAANGTASVTLAADSAITLPPGAASSSQITVSGTGTVGTITTGGTITSLTGGVATTVAPGSTISLTSGGTVTFAQGSAAIPSTLSTYAYVTTPATSTTPAVTTPTPSSWSGIGGLTQSTYAPSTGQANGPTTVTITQTAQQALLTWQTFNVGKNTTLDFDQSLGGANVGNWVAINQVAANIAPTQVLGSIQAPGQVYVINQNGIIFGGSSQVNAHALVASALQINPELVSGGLLNNSADVSYLFSSLEDGSGNLIFTPQATAETVGNGNVNSSTGGVTVNAGAQLTSPATPEHVGGKIALVGPTVDNEGTISTPDGQTILAAGLQVGLKAHDSNDPTLRGLDVYVGAATDPNSVPDASGHVTGDAVNGGDIEAPRADVTMAGANVLQNGVINSSTSVSLNGRIDLLGQYNSVSTVNLAGSTPPVFIDPSTTGTVTFGPNSVTQILPELSSTDTVVGSRLAESSLVNVEALNIVMGQGALLWAPSANIPTGISPTTGGVIVAEDGFGYALTSGVTFNVGNWMSNGISLFLLNNAGTIQLDPGAAIDVSGSTDVSASVQENIVAAQLRGTELADSPLQQNGPLRGQTVDIDISQYGTNADGTSWVGSPIGDLSGYAGLVQHNVGELTTNGGTVALNGGNQVSMDPTSSVDVSGGWINYQGAYVQTTKVVSNGQIYDISQATPNLVYSGVLSGFTEASGKYGFSQTYANLALTPQYEPGYVQGGNGGTLAITAAQIAVGNLEGNTVAGIRQITPQVPTTFGSSSGLLTEQSVHGIPTSSTLSLSFTDQTLIGVNAVSTSPTPADIVIQPGDGSGSLFPNPFAGDGITQLVNLPANLVSLDGFGNLMINNGDGNITVAPGAALSASPGGTISFQAANIDLLDGITTHGGTLSFSADLFSPYGDAFGDTSRGDFTLGSGATLDASGVVVNDGLGSSTVDEIPLLTAGGNITIAGYNVSLAQGSLVNVSGGVEVNAAGKQVFGKAGTLKILGADDAANNGPADDPDDAQISLGATLEGYSGLTSGAGTLDIQAPLFQIGGATLLNQDDSQNAVTQEGPEVWGNGTTLWLDKSGSSGDFFSQGGFGTIALTALGEGNRDQTLPSVLVAAGTNLNPTVQGWQAKTNGSDFFLAAETLPLASERAPLHLSLNALGLSNPFTQQPVTIGNIVMDAGSSLVTDPLGSVTLSGQTVAVRGNITAPGGAITITGGSSSAGVFFDETNPTQPLTTVDIAGDLSTAGVTELTFNSLGLRTGSVLPGGSISITGNIVGESTSSLDVSGASDTLEIPSELANTGRSLDSAYIATPYESNGGSISLSGKEELFWDGSLSGSPGGPLSTTSAHGGSLSISTGFFVPASGGTGTSHSPGDATLVVIGSGSTIQSLGTGVIGASVQGTQTVSDADGNPIYGYFAADKFDGSGLDALTLSGTLDFSGPVTLTANRSLSIASGGFLFADDAVTLTAPYVALGTAFPSPEAQQNQEINGGVFSNAVGGAFYLAPTYNANGVLNVNANELVDFGYLSLQGIGTLNINQGAASATAGDVRGAGILDVAGNINIAAGQIYPTTENTFTIAAYLDAGAGAVNSGNIVITRPTGATTLPQLPYSAGGTLNIFADNIMQGGVLRAPIGAIKLGASPMTADLLSPTDIFFDQSQNINLLSGSVTSVSAVDPVTGQGLIIPYGQNINGTEWQDPAGNNITASGNGAEGIPAKTIDLVGVNVQDNQNAVLDVTGGGDLYAYRFVTGTGGTNDILATTSGVAEGSFAIIPSYKAPYAPVDPTSGYVNGSNLSVGDRVYLNASNGLAAGYYTLLPARYALLPGAFLVTPETGTTANPQIATTALPDGSSIVSGYRYNGLTNPQPSASASGYIAFQVASESVVRTRAEYDDSFATSYLRQSAIAQNQPVPRLPNDAGQAVLNASQSLTFDGTLLGQPGTGGQGSLVDISSPSDILITSSTAPAGFDGLVLSSAQLDLLNAGSLLIGGTRAANGTDVTVATSSIEVDDSTDPLIGNDLILVSKDALTLDDNAVIQTVAASGLNQAPSLSISGDGALLRVSNSTTAPTTRTNVDTSDTTPLLTIGDGVRIESAASTASSLLPVGTLVLDSTAGIDISSSVAQPPVLSGNTLVFNGGLISVVFPDYTGTGNVTPTSGLVLSGADLQVLEENARNLSLLSYSSIDFYGDGSLGDNVSQQTVLQTLSLHASAIRGFAANANGGNSALLPAAGQSGISLDATQSISLDNSTGLALSNSGSDPSVASGELSFNTPVFELGGGTGNGAGNSVAVKGFDQVSVNATQEVVVNRSASVTNADTTVTNGQATLNIVGANLTLTTPIITGDTGSSEQINVAGGDVSILPGAAGDPPSATELGATLAISAKSITDAGNIVLHSGQVTLDATGTVAGDTDVTVTGSIDVSGISPSLQNLAVTKYTNGGIINLSSANGNVTVGPQGVINVSAASGTGTADSQAGNAGTLTVSAPTGSLEVSVGGQLLAQGGVVTNGVNGPVLAQGSDGNFNLDAATVGGTGGVSDLTSLEGVLAAGGFVQSQNIRIRTGDVEAIDAGSILTAHSFALSADAGSITVDGKIDASGTTGGAIDLDASGSVTVAQASVLTVEGQTFDAAGKGGSVSLNAGSFVGGTPSGSSVVTVAGEIDLKVDYLPVQLNNPSTQNSAGDSLTISNPGSTIPSGGTFYLPNGTPGNDMLLVGSAGSITNSSGTTAFSGSSPITVPAGSTVTLSNPNATISFASGTGGAIPIYLASDATFSAHGATNLTGGAALPAEQVGDVSGTLLIRGPALDSGGNVIPVNGDQTPASVAVGPITGSINNASSIIIEGYQVYEPAGGVIDGVEGTISTNGAALVANTGAIINAVFNGNTDSAALAALTTVEPGAEIVSTGDLILQNTWDLSALATSAGSTPASGTPFHFGPNDVPGILTLRAGGNLIFDTKASLTDGFDNSTAGNSSGKLWLAPLLPSGIRSWTYNLVAGSDLTAANPLQVNNDVGTASGEVEIGLGSASVDSTAIRNAGVSGPTSSTPLLTQFYQTIRTGTGDINIASGNDVQLLDALASIYTAGTQVANPTSVLAANDFALPNLVYPRTVLGPANNSPYPAQYSLEGGNVSISALGDIENVTSSTLDDSNLVPDSSRELPTSWLDRRGFVYNGVFAATHSGAAKAGEIESTSWWTDFSNFFEGVGALGGGNVSLIAGGSVSNVDAVVPTNARMPGLNASGQGIAPNASSLVELGGGNLVVQAGYDVDGGVYYVERGRGTLSAGNSIITNSTRAALTLSNALDLTSAADPSTWLPTTLFLGKGSFDVTAGNSVYLGPVANPFLLPQNINNSFLEKSYFSTYAAGDSVNVTSLTGNTVIKDDSVNGNGSLSAWYEQVLLYYNNNVVGQLSWSFDEPWLRLDEEINLSSGADPFATAYTLMPATLRATAFSGDIDLLGSLTLSPSPTGTVDLVAVDSINGLEPNAITNSFASISTLNPALWSTASINLSDANPSVIPGIANPLSLSAPTTSFQLTPFVNTSLTLFSGVNDLFAETGSTDALLQTKQALHADINGETLHANDTNPIQIYAGTGDISGLTLFAGKSADVTAGLDITDIALYLQNNRSTDLSLVSAGRDILPYDATSPLRLELESQDPTDSVSPLAGDIQLGGPGALEVLAGRNLNLGVPSSTDQQTFASAGEGFGITSIGNERNPLLPVSGADIIAGSGFSDSNGFESPNYAAFINSFLAGSAEGDLYLPDLGTAMGLSDASDADIVAAFNALSASGQQALAPTLLTIFYDVLRDAGRNSTGLGARYSAGYDAIAALFPGQGRLGDITLSSREIKTESGGNIGLLAPGGQITVGLPVNGASAVDQGILTVDGGNISIFADGNVNVGTSRIFTLHGGNEIIWSSTGDIAAGASSKTVQSAPPTRVLVDPESGNIVTDLAGLATGGGIGVLETVAGAPPGDVDLIAPRGFVDAGDAGIRASGNLNIAALQVLNASNISVGGKSSGVPTATAPNLAGLSAASSATGAANNAASQTAASQRPNDSQQLVDVPSIITVEVLGYGGG